jgi:RNA polymerase sigma-70 factor (ECF subfamily)
VLLDEQDRTLWDAGLIAQGCGLVQQALATRRFGPYCLQAAIAAVHAEAPSAAQTDWPQIIGLYDVLLRMLPSPVIELNHAAALAMRDGPLAGLQQVEGILARGELLDYHLAHSARGEFCRQLGRMKEARQAYEKALALTHQTPEKRFIERRLATCTDTSL